MYYGPYGGYSYNTGYNPNTGRYGYRETAWDGDDWASYGESYNPRTGIQSESSRRYDADILPSPEASNLDALSSALGDLDARLRVETDPDGLAFDPHPALIASMATLNLTTRCGDLDLTFQPAGLDGAPRVAEAHPGHHGHRHPADGAHGPGVHGEGGRHGPRSAGQGNERGDVPLDFLRRTAHVRAR